MTNAAEAAPPAARELSLTRLIDASPELCFEAWTEHLPAWWGPHGMATPVCEMDLRAARRTGPSIRTRACSWR